VKQNEISLKLYDAIFRKINFICNNTSNIETQTEILKFQKISESAFECKDVDKMKFVLKQVKRLENKIRGAKLSRQKKPDFNKREHYQNNILAINLLTNKRLIQIATDKRYKKFDSLPKNIPSTIVNEINNRNITQVNGKPHTIETVSYLAKLHRERIEIKKIIKRRNVKVVQILFLILIFIIGFYYLKINKKMNLNLFASLQSENKRIWMQNEIIETVNLYEQAQNVEITDWRTGKIIEATSDIYISENELIFKIDSVAKHKYTH